MTFTYLHCVFITNTLDTEKINYIITLNELAFLHFTYKFMYIYLLITTILSYDIFSLC